MTPAQERRLRELRSRVAVRAFDYRQRRHARGVWYRLRRLLAQARAAYVLPREEAETLLAEGYAPDPVGLELEPARTILVVPAERVSRIGSARPLAVRLTAELLSAPCLALVAFPCFAEEGGRRTEA